MTPEEFPWIAAGQDRHTDSFNYADALVDLVRDQTELRQRVSLSGWSTQETWGILHTELETVANA